MLKQIYLINTDLKMDKGKIAIQVAHGTTMYMDKILQHIIQHHAKSDDIYVRYNNWRAITEEDDIGMMKKIVLKSTEKEMRDIHNKLKSLNIWSYLIFDRGLTQIPEHSLTCLVVEPLEESQCDSLFGNLKLL